MKTWKHLQENDLIAIVAPASKGPMEEALNGASLLQSWGFRTYMPKNIFGKNLLHSHSEAVRADHLLAALENPGVKAIWCLRGGYGSMKLLPSLEAWSRTPAGKKVLGGSRAKLFVGLSDITSLHMYFNQVWHWQTLHAPVLCRLGRRDLPKKTIQELYACLTGKQKELEFSLKPLNPAAKSWKGAGNLVGGNLTLVQASLGTRFQLKLANQILFLEEAGERGYRLDRMWTQLMYVKDFQKLKAIVLGDFTQGDEPNGDNHVTAVLKECANRLLIPVYTGLPAGHGDIQRTLPLGGKVKISDQKLLVGTGGTN